MNERTKKERSELQRLVQTLAHRRKLTLVDARALMDLMLELVADAVLERGRFTWPGFGTWRVTTRKARGVLNPQTGVRMELPRTVSIRFRPAKALRLELAARRRL